jgi:uncharacterized membrane protein YtjA (UPF0391 family)
MAKVPPCSRFGRKPRQFSCASRDRTGVAAQQPSPARQTRPLCKGSRHGPVGHHLLRNFARCSFLRFRGQPQDPRPIAKILFFIAIAIFFIVLVGVVLVHLRSVVR